MLIFHAVLDLVTIVLLWTVNNRVFAVQLPRRTFWFGADDTYQCHCAENAACGTVDGACSNGCDSDWFGPRCQYDVSEFTAASNLTWLTDNDDETCNDGDSQSITVHLDTFHPLTWFRVVLREAGYHYREEYELTYVANGSQSDTDCPYAMNAWVNSLTLDISCPTAEVVTQFTLSGNIVKVLCSLYISGGRNVALKQKAEQSTQLATWYASNAVDGRLGRPGDVASQRGTCTHTLPGRPQGTWTLTFSKHQVAINRFVIYNRRDPDRSDCCEDRLKNFSLEALPRSGWDGMFRYTDPGGAAQNAYTVIPSPPIDFLVKRVRISTPVTENSMLTLCEVVIFGDVVCPSRRYGLQCEGICNCVKNVNCLVSTGGCPIGCAQGYTGENCWIPCPGGTYGFECNQTCNVKCGGHNNLCHHVDGACLSGCDPGYTGIGCHKKCPAGKFGLNCSQPCSNACAVSEKTCDHVTGSCHEGCAPGYQSPQCDVECAEGTYGVNCSETCTDRCIGESPNLCNHVSGACDQGCDDGYRGPFCQDVCPNGRYGSECKQLCSDHCFRHSSDTDSHSCDPVSGACHLGCEIGYLSPVCDEACPRGTYGKDCKQECSIHCAGPDKGCDHLTGTCYRGCEPGFYSSTCDDKCQSGTHGPGCKQICNVHCAGPSDSCHHADGSCDLGCDPGYHTVYCNQTCARGRYGANCSETCSEHCGGLHHACSHVDGACYIGCEEGYAPPQCARVLAPPEKPSGSGKKALGITLGTIAAAAVLLAVVIFGAYLCRTLFHMTFGPLKDKVQTSQSSAVMNVAGPD